MALKKSKKQRPAKPAKAKSSKAKAAKMKPSKKSRRASGDVHPDFNLPAAMLPPGVKHDDFRSSLQWRVLRIMSEFVSGWNFLADIKKSVSIFGSARFTEDNHWYKEARKLGKMLADNRYSVVTGGGPGIMEAGNRGASEGGGAGDSFGLDIKLPYEQRVNPFVEKSEAFHYFFVRKVMLAYAAQAYVYFPGGYGTLDELTELVTLVQTKKIAVHIPMILVGKKFWSPFLKWIDEMIINEYGAASPEDRKIYQLVDTAEEAFAIIKKSPIRKQFG